MTTRPALLSMTLMPSRQMTSTAGRACGMYSFITLMPRFTAGKSMSLVTSKVPTYCADDRPSGGWVCAERGL